jgi:hypothetical protein
MSANDRRALLALAAGGALSVVTVIALCRDGDAKPAPRPAAAVADEEPGPKVAAPAVRFDAVMPKAPAALVKAPTQLTLAAYELTPATFTAWRDYLLGDPRGRLWERIAWRTSLWDGVVDAHAEDRPILLEIHGGNALGRC